jgi:kynureninase
VAERVLLTGHSHQAWPDRAFDGQARAFLDAACHVDDKWQLAFTVAEQVRAGFARLLGVPAAEIALGPSTHDLLVRWLSALDLGRRPRIVTTDGEFHSARRQLDRLAEHGIEVARVAAEPARSVGERLAAAVDERTAAVVISAVFFGSGRIAGGLDAVQAACERSGAQLLVDAYHALGVLPFELRARGLERAFVVGGGYKYLQLGEGNCFLRVPPGGSWRPAITGWFAEFSALEAAPSGSRVAYPTGAEAFTGATYDPASHYRAAAVFDFFAEQGLEPALLRDVSQRQLGILAAGFDTLDADPRMARRDRGTPLDDLGGFLVLRCPRAAELCGLLRMRGVFADSRGDALRLGPAPYLGREQLERAVGALGETLSTLA